MALTTDQGKTKRLTSAQKLLLSVAAKPPSAKEEVTDPTSEQKPSGTDPASEPDERVVESSPDPAKPDERVEESKQEEEAGEGDSGKEAEGDSVKEAILRRDSLDSLLDESSEDQFLVRAKKEMKLIPGKCPFENLKLDISNTDARKKCPFAKAFHSHAEAPKPTIKKAPKLKVRFGTFATTTESAALLKDIGGGDKIREACTRFYARAFKDKLIAPFMTVMKDGASYHGKRLGDWIVEKMGGEGSPWSDSGRYGMRQQSHHLAWNAKSRDPEVRGEHFKLDDCRVWMRLHFWAFREVGLAKHKAFWKWYVSFIGRFIGIYERTAPRFAVESAKWSGDEAKIEKYLKADCSMKDVIGVGRYPWSTRAVPAKN